MTTTTTKIAETLRVRAARLRAGDEVPGGSAWGYVPNVLVSLADEIEAGLDGHGAPPEDRATALRYSIGPALLRRIEAVGFERGTMNPVAWLVAEVERLRAEADERTRLATRQVVDEREQIVDLIEQHAGSVDDPRLAEELIKLAWTVEARGRLVSPAVAT